MKIVQSILELSYDVQTVGQTDGRMNGQQYTRRQAYKTIKQYKNTHFIQFISFSWWFITLPFSHNLIPLAFKGHGVVALKKLAVSPELHFLDTVHWLKTIAVLEGPYCFKVGLELSTFLTPLCWPNRFSIRFELINPGLILLPFLIISWHKEIKPEIEEFMSSLVSLVIKCLLTIPCSDLVTWSSQELKKIRTSLKLSNLLSLQLQIGWFTLENISTRIYVFSSSSIEDASSSGLFREAWYTFIR